MNDDRLDLSDWIQYLISVRSINNTLMIAYFSAMIGILSIMIIILINFSSSKIVAIPITVLILVVFFIIARYCILAYSNRSMSTKILHDIMKGNKNNPSVIMKEWSSHLKKE